MSRCAIYTRKSTEERLDMRFNSLEAQTDACEAYIASQRHAGWKSLDERFEDAGISGGTLDRPALQRLLGMIRNREIDVIVVHKVDRLTRSLSDFATLAELFEKHGVSFVSVTQHLDTSTSMGRLSLNVLLSFAQFEREIASERIKEKIHASRKRGLWTGGRVPLGYRAIDKKLHIHSPEAALVRAIFKRYEDLRSVTDLRLQWQADHFPPTAMARGDAETKITVRKPPSRGALYTILRNPVYISKIRCGDELVDGIHDPIIDQDAWLRVQRILDRNRPNLRHARQQPANGALLGKLFDKDGCRLTRSHTRKKNGSRYDYYVSAASTQNSRSRARSRIPCNLMDTLVRDHVLPILADTQQRVVWAEVAALSPDAFNAVVDWKLPEAREEQDGFVFSLIERVEVRDGSARVTISAETLVRQILDGGQLGEMKALARHTFDVNDPILASTTDAPKRRIIRMQKTTHRRREDGRRWFALLATGKAKDMYEIAAAYGVSQPTVSRTIAEALEI